jgi:hypothetical protein
MENELKLVESIQQKLFEKNGCKRQVIGSSPRELNNKINKHCGDLFAKLVEKLEQRFKVGIFNHALKDRAWEIFLALPQACGLI